MADEFYASLPVIADFGRAVAADAYAPLPADWSVGFADVRGSTEAVGAGRYKAVNMIGAGVVAAVSNALHRRPFPFVFGGDGASFAVPAEDGPAAREALAAMATFAQEEFDLELRIAFASVADIREGGRDVRVARYGPSPFCAYAMFAGGGLSWLDAEAKKGRFALKPAPPEVRPDLSHLSCRFGVTPARYGLILSLIVSPRDDDPRFGPFVADLVRDALGAEDEGRPVTVESLIAGPPAQAIGLEAAAMRTQGSSGLGSRLKAALFYGVGYVFKAFDVRLGDFDMKQYKSDLVANADFRKFDDGLRMTLDCSEAFADRIEAKLKACDFVEWGTQRQTHAQITCYSPLAEGRGHLHFIDGAGGGYTLAAKALKGRRAG